VESAVFFDELIRSGRDKQMTSPNRGNGFRSARLIPAVEYLQAQRARTMMMMKLAEATADVDVYLVPANSGGGGGGRGGRGAAVATDGAPPAGGGRGGRGGGGGAFARSAVNRHFSMANLACYPAINVPNGFTDEGTPTALTIYGRPFAEAEVLAVAKAYQDASGFHLKHPKLDDEQLTRATA
jgi:Asp-tRNA(Asn)/Glu-tRNA(Gln) amidotransferase A subunit family amidase